MKHFGRFIPSFLVLKQFGLSLGLFLLLAPSVGYARLSETFFFKGNPSLSTVQKWSELPGTRRYTLHLYSPSLSVLQALLELAKASSTSHIHVEVDTYPSLSTSTPLLEAWQRLASKSTTFVGLNSVLPNEGQIQALNKIGFKNHIFVIAFVPTVTQANRMGLLQGKHSITFAMNRFPLHHERPNLMAFPKNTPLRFQTDYWPMYTHMDIFNLIPHSIFLRIKGILPSTAALEYLHHIHRLEEVTLSTDFPIASRTQWEAFKNLNLHWIAQGFIPSPQALEYFSAAAQKDPEVMRRLTLDHLDSLTSKQRKELEASTLEVEWIRDAPFQ